MGQLVFAILQMRFHQVAVRIRDKTTCLIYSVDSVALISETVNMSRSNFGLNKFDDRSLKTHAPFKTTSLSESKFRFHINFEITTGL